MFFWGGDEHREARRSRASSGAYAWDAVRARDGLSSSCPAPTPITENAPPGALSPAARPETATRTGVERGQGRMLSLCWRMGGIRPASMTEDRAG
jgi:hypothetical protein